MSWTKWLALLPFLAVLGGAPLFNATQPIVLGMPLLLAWLVFCVLLSSAVMAVVYLADPRRRAEARR